MKIIYDIGANNGDDIPYYLMKADLVVAIEANPALCNMISQRFAQEIAAKRLCVENVVVTDQRSKDDVEFYIHKYNHVLSQFPRPASLGDYDVCMLKSMHIIDIIEQYGAPYYVKVDIEHYDEIVLRALFDNEIYPPYISAESHDIGVFSALVSRGNYNSFKLVDGASVPQVYANHAVQLGKGTAHYSFPVHSAGPFGEDVNGQWMTSNNFFRLLGFVGLGWKDIHATNVFSADPRVVASIKPELKIEIHGPSKT